jgi:hypothetical protein
MMMVGFFSFSSLGARVRVRRGEDSGADLGISVAASEENNENLPDDDDDDDIKEEFVVVVVKPL